MGGKSADGLLLTTIPVLWDVRGTVSLRRLCWGAPVHAPVLSGQLFVLSLYCSSMNGERSYHLGMGNCCTQDLTAFL